MSNPARRYAHQYHQTSIVTQVSEADPHKLVALLLNGVCRRVRLAQASLHNHDQARKGKAIADACAILGYLADILDKPAGGQIAENLGELYTYAMQRLTLANADNDPALLDEVLEILQPVDSAWNQIPASARTLPARQ